MSPSKTARVPDTFCKFSRLPEEKLSNTETSSPRATRARASADPMNPAPPVMTIFFDMRLKQAGEKSPLARFLRRGQGFACCGGRSGERQPIEASTVAGVEQEPFAFSHRDADAGQALRIEFILRGEAAGCVRRCPTGGRHSRRS